MARTRAFFVRQPCSYCRTYTSHTTSTCPSPDAKAARNKRHAHRVAVRKLIAETVAPASTTEVVAGCGHVVPLTDAGLCKHCGAYICSDRGYDGACAPTCETCGACARRLEA